MNWLMIVLIAGNFSFAKIVDDEAECTKVGVFYTQGIEYAASYVCIKADAISLME